MPSAPRRAAAVVLLTALVILAAVVACVVRRRRLVASDTHVSKTLTGQSVEHISVHPDASLSGDILSIEHSPNQARITLRLKQNGRCPRPFLRGRLSGPALVAIDHWQYPSEGTAVGRYQAPPFRGKYYLDIIVVFCDNFLDVDGIMPWNNSYDFSKTCTDAPTERQLTSPNATISVVMTAEEQSGYWVHSQSFADTKPLYTRFQPRGCYNPKPIPNPRCNPPSTSVEPFQQYEWRWYGKKAPSIANFPSPPVTICLLGSSHAHRMYEILQNEGLTNNNVTKVQYYDMRMPFQVNVSSVQPLIHKDGCQRLVISVGQWPSGRRYRINAEGPVAFSQLYRQYQTMLNGLYQAFPDVTILCRSINYNPLGAMIGGCPPTDWRSPTVIDGYNAVIQRVVEEIDDPDRMRFIDTNFLVGPVWDAASDWCHLDERVGLPHAIYVLAQALEGGTESGAIGGH